MPMGIKRDNLGLLVLDNIRMSNKKDVESYDGFRFVYNGITYYFKNVRSLEYLYNEMLAYEIAKEFGIEAIPYDIATYNGEVGYLSQDFFQPGMVYLEDLLKNFYGDDHNKCNLSDVEFMMGERFDEDTAKSMSAQLIELLMFDLIIGNTDRHDRNIIIDVNKKKVAPAFDNELMLQGAVYKEHYCFSLFPSEKDTLDAFVKYMDDDVFKRFVDKIEIINNDNVLRIMARVEKKIGVPLNDMIKQRLIKRFHLQYSTLLMAVKERKNAMRLDLRRDGDNNGSC